VGGYNDTGFLNSAEVFDVTTHEWRMISNMLFIREDSGVGDLEYSIILYMR